MLLILVPNETNRLRYAMQLMLTRLLGLEIGFTNKLSEFEHYEVTPWKGSCVTYPTTCSTAHQCLLFGLIICPANSRTAFPNSDPIFVM